MSQFNNITNNSNRTLIIIEKHPDSNDYELFIEPSTTVKVNSNVEISTGFFGRNNTIDVLFFTKKIKENITIFDDTPIKESIDFSLFKIISENRKITLANNYSSEYSLQIIVRRSNKCFESFVIEPNDTKIIKNSWMDKNCESGCLISYGYIIDKDKDKDKDKEIGVVRFRKPFEDFINHNKTYETNIFSIDEFVCEFMSKELFTKISSM